MFAALQTILQSILVFMGRVISIPFISVTVTGLEHIPRSESLILVSNHFSWFDGPLLMIYLPVRIVFLLAVETERVCFFRFLSRTFNLIPIWRGQVDRKAMRAAIAALKEGRTIGVFPEGGIDPTMAAARERGERIEQIAGHTARHSANLIQAQSGIGLLATQAQTRLLPVALLGTEKILINLRRLRRTQVRIRVGRPFGPLSIPDDTPRKQRRRHFDSLTQDTMRHIAALLPPGNRGPYQDVA
ncbi:MAG: lysophospholipid acyltransferase family protein [Caldilineaceae bacterium]|nr:lysophospholipid acyltransferase family protein [Caldilineaceae bacterium]MCY4092338.1 lysophospholipid acyltransferase family protein [Caldilineaceae bacterium]MCY4116106.1 lysophospholipid acyltransferase family protein [Caldilineaceae bacterium]MDE0071271.1 lysophospholipid acyltransferase family protein [Caldilineaceae bacterium]MDE0180743.1 lysophospholipid acyltransferase family protein [Caldilineaceae bacterium]